MRRLCFVLRGTEFQKRVQVARLYAAVVSLAKSLLQNPPPERPRDAPPLLDRLVASYDDRSVSSSGGSTTDRPSTNEDNTRDVTG